MSFKIPESVLVVIHTPELKVLMMERLDWPGWWQSVTGSRETHDASLADTARREVREETGLDVGEALSDWALVNRYAIYGRWRPRYAPEVTHNVEHTFGVEVAAPFAARLHPEEHGRYVWLNWRDALCRCYSGTNRAALIAMAERKSLSSRAQRGIQGERLDPSLRSG
ncbi:MAG: dihydroneopterin triphosphate diphosphatase [Reyranellaceae bacterium]